MNHIYRSIWNASSGTMTAVCEHAKSRGKRNSGGRSAVVRPGFIVRSVSVAVAMACSPAALALPTGGLVVAGEASITNAASDTTIHQTTQNAALTWQAFDIGVAETVRFVQPNSDSVALNRVLGSDPSSILGGLSSNGKVFLVNPNGILFGTGARVNVGALVASTRDIADDDFMAGRYAFKGDGNGSVVNRGSIQADGGYVALLGARVSNQGVIAARMGSIAMASGNAITLDVAGDGLLNVSVDAGSVDALVENGGLIRADGGQVLLTARSAGDLMQSAVNNTGLIQAQTLENRNGTIRLLGDMDSGAVNVAGTLDASAPDGGDGGFIDTSAALVNVASETRVTTAAARGLTGSWLIDPTDYSVAANGGNITGAALSNNLAVTNVTIQSVSGNLNVNDTVAWSAHRLTLNSQNDININTAMNASGTASLALVYGQGAVAAGNTGKVNVNAPVNLPAGNNFSTLLGSNGVATNYVVITSLGAAGSATGTDLQGINGNLTGNYVLGSNIDAAATSTWNAGAGFEPLGTDPSRFTGIFDGLGHTVSGLFIDRTGSPFVGLFGYTDAGSVIRNTGSIGGSVASDSWSTGALIGALGGTVINSYATGTVRGFQTVGGLVGVIDGGAIIDSHATGDVVAYGGTGEAGGLVGLNWGVTPGTVENSYATGNVSSLVGYAGGLMAINWGAITNSYATGTVTGLDSVGGLVGSGDGSSTISNSYATGAATGRNNVGGLVGDGGSISNSYATGAVIGVDAVGGLAGNFNGTATNNYATGTVVGNDRIGGLVGNSNRGSFTGNHASGAVNGNDNVGGLIGYSADSTIIGNYANSAVTGRNSVGGLAGAMSAGSQGYGYNHGNGGEFSNNYASGMVTGVNFAGGLIGTNWAEVSDSHATGAVTGDDQVGGLVGGFQSGTIASSFATGNVTARSGAAGGLVGYASATIESSYATGAVAGLYQVGGILGAMNGGTITNAYATGSVTGTGNVGGLVGNSSSGVIANVYSIGATTGTTDVGGLLGSSDGASITSGFWDVTTSGQAASAGGVGLTTAQMQEPANFTGFNFTTTAGATGNNWVIVNFDGPLNGSSAGTRPMLASEYSTTIMSAHQLQLMSMDLGATYTLGKTIDASATGTANDVWTDGSFVPVGKSNNPFAGVLDGLGQTIDHLHVDLPDAQQTGFNLNTAMDEAGLFGYIGSAGIVQNVGLVDGSVVGRDFAGGLVGRSAGTVTNSYATGDVQGRSYVGGLAGFNDASGTVTDSYATGSVTGLLGAVGGLIGISEGSISGSYATGAVQGGESHIGGLVGTSRASISNSYASGSVTGVNGSSYVGGLVGTNYGAIDNSYATGAVESFNYVGGLIGDNYATVSNTYSTGLVRSDNTVGGLIAGSYGSVTDSFWNTQTSGQASSSGGGGLTTAQMMQLASFSSWNTTTPDTIASTANSGASWRIYDGYTAPLLTRFLTALTLSNTVVTYNGASQSAAGVIPSGVLGTTATDAGIYSFYSSQQGFDLTGGSLTIARADLSLTGTRIYDGSTSIAGSDLTAIGVAGESFAVTGLGDASNLASRNVQSTSTLNSVTGLALGAGINGGLSNNYNALSTLGSSFSVTQASLTLSASDVVKTYDGGLMAVGTAIVTSGTLFGSDAISGGNFAFIDKNAGGNKAVTLTGVTIDDGNSGANYDTSYTANVTSTIERAVLTATAAAADKTYDGNTSATTTLNVVGLVDSETLGATSISTFNSKDVATATLVTVDSIVLSDGANGGLASNYSLASGQTASARVTPRVLTVVGQVAMDKIYDGTTMATLRGGSLAGVLHGETLVLDEAGTFATAHPGIAIAVTAADSLSGADAANYTLTQPLGLTADIARVVQPDIPVVNEPVATVPPITAPPVVVVNAARAATSTVAYTSAIAHVASNIVAARMPAPEPLTTRAPEPASKITSGSGAGTALMTYDIGGLNLTVVTADDETDEKM